MEILNFLNCAETISSGLMSKSQLCL